MQGKTAFIFIEVSEFSAGALKPIDGLSAGTFTSMWGDKVEFKPEELEEYASKTKRVISSTKTEGGEVVGLPIDMDMHDHRGGAGWIKDVIVDMERKILRFMVEWTEDGADVIRKNIRRFFSPSVDTENHFVLGGSLTNWPATRDSKSGKILLRPIELSSQIKEIDMPKTIEELSADLEAQGTQITSLVGAVNTLVTKIGELSKPTTPETPPSDGDEVSQEIKDLLGNSNEVEELGRIAANKAKEVIKAEKRKSVVVEFASRIAGGTKEKPFGLKVKPAEIVALVLSLPEKQGNAVMRILEQSLDAAIDFAEHGVDSEGFLNKPEMPKQVLELARTWVKSGKTIEEFFSVNAAELGSPDNYNLSEFKKVKE
jgi:hypothetical protein